MSDDTFDLLRRPVHLGLDAIAAPQEVFTGDSSWYARYAERVAADGSEGRLVAIHRFDAPWSMWEMHPHGHEVVVCLEGRITLIQQRDGAEVDALTLTPYQAAINAPGVWHTADVDAPAAALFITAGLGTEHKPR